MPGFSSAFIAEIKKVASKRRRYGLIGWMLLFSATAVRILLWALSLVQPLSCNTEQTIVGQVREPPKSTQQRISMQLRVLEAPDCKVLVDRYLRLSWYDPTAPLSAGDEIQLTVRVRKPWGAVNPGGFDYQLWLYGQNIFATGYVTQFGGINEDIDGGIKEEGLPEAPHGVPPSSSVFAVDLDNEPILRAMALGERYRLNEADWTLFRRTGAVHLVVVSGLHVSLFAGAVFLIVGSLLRLLPGDFVQLPRTTLALLASAVSVGILVCVTGLQPAVLRAALTFVCAMSFVLFLRQGDWGRLLWLVMAMELLLMPQYVLRIGFWLSFVAVFCLLRTFGYRLRRYSYLQALTMTQLYLFVGMLPWLSLFVGEIPVNAPLSNLLVVPWLSTLCIPWAMAGFAGIALGLPGAALLLHVADWSLSIALRVLREMGTLPGAIGYFQLGGIGLGLLATRLAQMPLPRALLPPVYLALVSMFNHIHNQIPKGAFRIHVLDVGQGSAAIVQTQRHNMLIDTGPMYRSGFDSGERIVLPAIKRLGIRRIDRILTTHGDTDHAGGLSSLSAYFPSARRTLLSSECAREDDWTWDDVRFALAVNLLGSNANERSCTVIVAGQRARAYFSGDIGYQSELALLPQLPHDVDLLVAPHHGSASSSHPAFVNQLRPRVAVFSAGLDNRYRHPRPQVIARYNKVGTVSLVTGAVGAIQFDSWRRGWVFVYRPWRVLKRPIRITD